MSIERQVTLGRLVTMFEATQESARPLAHTDTHTHTTSINEPVHRWGRRNGNDVNQTFPTVCMAWAQSHSAGFKCHGQSATRSDKGMPQHSKNRSKQKKKRGAKEEARKRPCGCWIREERITRIQNSLASSSSQAAERERERDGKQGGSLTALQASTTDRKAAKSGEKRKE